MANRRPCPTGKRRFKSRRAALNAMRGAPILPSAYQCKLCRYWHVTRQARW